MKPRVALLLVNLGTPESPTTEDVRTYLRQFLSDPRVLDINPIGRKALLEGVILRRRPKESAHAYQQVWTDEGSPLLVFSRSLQSKVQDLLGEEILVELAMRYGNPSIPDVLSSLRERGYDRIVVFPLYPHYAASSTGTVVEEVMDTVKGWWCTPSLCFVPAFAEHPAYIEAAAIKVREAIDEVQPEKVIFSFHGLPERHCSKCDDSGEHCLVEDDCCDQLVLANRNCYRAHCVATARALGDALELPEEQRVLCFQSRLGSDPWIKPYTDEVVVELAKSGVRKAVILSPAFVADCLETLEELGIRAADDFCAAGGEQLRLVPCMNDSDEWARALIQIASESSAWIPSVD